MDMPRGGTNNQSNLTACCIPCNTKKSNKLISEWLPNSSTRFHPDVHPIPPDNKKEPLILTSFLSGEILSIKEESKKESGIRAREKKRLGPLPENWQPPATAYALAVECGTTVPIVEAIFRDYLKSSGKLYADHNAAFCNFVRNQRNFTRSPQGSFNAAQKSGGSLIAAIDRQLAALRAEEETGIELPEDSFRRLSG
jgi:hypothetical protein